jgi:hypothetical protein
MKLSIGWAYNTYSPRLKYPDLTSNFILFIYLPDAAGIAYKIQNNNDAGFRPANITILICCLFVLIVVSSSSLSGAICGETLIHVSGEVYSLIHNI